MTIPAEDRPLEGPVPSPETLPYFEAANRGQLLVKTCRACGETHFYPRSLCPFCFSDETEWKEASGEGVIYSFSVMRRAPVPYAIAYVALDEGVTMMSNIVDCDLDAIRIGQRVKVTFKPTQTGYSVPMFSPSSSG